MQNTTEYRLISNHYGDQVAKRSQVRLMDHIDQGLIILDDIGATVESKKAFCLHPLFQNDVDLVENRYMSSFIDPYALLLTMEYRSVANEYLSDKVNTDQKIRLSPLLEVNDMLVADKVQNRKDFITHHKGTHARSAELDIYFKKWMAALDISEEKYNRLCKSIDHAVQKN